MVKTDVDSQHRGTSKRLWSAGVRAAGLAAAVNAVFFLVASVGGYLSGPQAEGDLTMTIGLASVFTASVTAALLGTAVFAAFRRFVKHPVAIMGLVGGAVLLIASFVPYVMAPGGIRGISTANCRVVAILELMHGFTAIITLGVLSNWSRHHEPDRSLDIARDEPLAS